ncbi:hypothetical protein P171DRAFT_492003 [Karstenula rhodostoma CBS 690.94]|uniref:Uncharacterized protein n=1 Tax=Karstenula rhodostoma CBS 690.94 TaxID=1392251 RepID=A0A9P4U542_9PLEO|nr:hypothetical protein P171DRAFT_492003 [Karstenula rhodostoma CBS 690.94]
MHRARCRTFLRSRKRITIALLAQRFLTRTFSRTSCLKRSQDRAGRIHKTKSQSGRELNLAATNNHHLNRAPSSYNENGPRSAMCPPSYRVTSLGEVRDDDNDIALDRAAISFNGRSTLQHHTTEREYQERCLRIVVKADSHHVTTCEADVRSHWVIRSCPLLAARPARGTFVASVAQRVLAANAKQLRPITTTAHIDDLTLRSSQASQCIFGAQIGTRSLILLPNSRAFSQRDISKKPAGPSYQDNLKRHIQE